MDITTAARVKAHLKAGGKPLGDSYDTWLAEAVTAYSALAEREMNRKLEATERTVYFDVSTHQEFVLEGVPISDVSSVRSDRDRDFPATSEVDTDNYVVKADDGILVVDGTVLDRGHHALKVVYTGGMGADADAILAAFPELVFAIDMQIAYHARRISSPGKTSTSVAGGSTTWTGPLKWLDHVRETLRALRM